MNGVVNNLKRNSFPVQEAPVEEAPKRTSFLGKLFGKKKEKTIDDVQISKAQGVIIHILKNYCIGISGERLIEHDEYHFS